MAAGRMKFMDELMAAGGNENDDNDLTESDSDRAGRGRYDSNSASDAAEDLNLMSSDDDDDDDGDDDESDDDGGRGLFKDESDSDDGDSDYDNAGAAGDRDDGDVDIEPNEEVDDESIDLNDNHDINHDDMDMDDDQDDEDSDDDEDDGDDEDDEPEDENGDMEEKLLNVRQVTREEFEREAQYEEEDEEIVVKEEQGVRSLFGDDDGDGDDDSEDDAAGNGRANINLITQEESAEEDNNASVMDSKDLSFTDELMQSRAGSVDGSVVVESGEQKPLELGVHEQFEMKAAVLHIISKVSLSERRALKRGHKLEGPPMEDPIAHVDEFKRKFRWPVRVINLPKKDFSQDPVEIYNDYELNLKKRAVDSEPQPGQEPHWNPRQSRAKSAFSHVPSPIVEAAAKAAAQQQHQQQVSRKRQRSTQREEPYSTTASAAALTNVARIGERFADRFLESLISDNAAALQGTNNGYSQRDWTTLPISRKPVANWRFVLENATRSSGEGGASTGDRLCPPMRKETLQRIRDRLKTLHSLPWKTADDELFNAVDRLADTPVVEAAELLDDRGILML